MGGLPQQAGGQGTLATLSSLVKPFIGSGALALPRVWSEGGIVASTLFLIILTYVASWCIFRLVDCSDLIMKAEARRNMQTRILRQRNPSQDIQLKLFEVIPGLTDDMITEEDEQMVPIPSFTEIGACAYGVWGALVVDICIIITQLGGCVAYTIFISTAMNEVTGLSTWLWVLILFLPLVSLALLRRIELLAPAAYLGNFVYIIVLVVIFYQGFANSCCIKMDEINTSDWHKYPLIFGTLSFALEGIVLVLPVKKALRRQQDFGYIMTLAMLIIFFVYFFVAGFGYLFFGDETLSPVLSNLDDGWASDSVKVLLSISLFFTFGLQCFPVSQFFDIKIDSYFDLDFKRLRREKQLQDAQEYESNIASQQPSNVINGSEQSIDVAYQPYEYTDAELVPEEVSFKRMIYQNIVRVLFCVFVCVIAIIFPDFHLIVALFGSFSNAMLAYIFPAILWAVICAPFIFTGKPNFKYNRDGTPINSIISYSDSYVDGVDDVLTNEPALVRTTSQTSSINNPDDVSTTNSTKRSGIPSSNEESRPLFGKSDDNENINTSNEDDTPHVPISKFVKFSYLFFPYTVAVLGCAASAIGVTAAVKEIVDHFTHGDDK